MFIMAPIGILAPSLTIDGDQVMCNLESLRRTIFLVLQGVPFDEKWYLDAYPDVHRAIADGLVASASDHYRRSGYLEGRMPLDPHVDEAWYRQTYPEVSRAIDEGTVADARTHFIESGWREGRQPCEVPVDPSWYTTAYPHVQQRMAREGEHIAGQDFIRHGYYEGLMPFRPVG